MEYTIFGTPQQINFAPQNVVEEVSQNVRTLICTKKMSVPLDRSLGLDFNVIDRPVHAAQAAYRVEIIEAIRKYEPRAKVLRVDFDGTAIDGHLIPTVKIRIDEEA